MFQNVNGLNVDYTEHNFRKEFKFITIIENHKYQDKNSHSDVLLPAPIIDHYIFRLNICLFAKWL